MVLELSKQLEALKRKGGKHTLVAIPLKEEPRMTAVLLTFRFDPNLRMRDELMEKGYSLAPGSENEYSNPQVSADERLGLSEDQYGTIMKFVKSGETKEEIQKILEHFKNRGCEVEGDGEPFPETIQKWKIWPKSGS